MLNKFIKQNQKTNQTVAVKQSYCLDCDGNETARLENNMNIKCYLKTKSQGNIHR